MLDVHSHNASYATDLIEGDPIELSPEGEYLALMDLNAHSGRQLWGIAHFDPKAEVEQEAAEGIWNPGLSLDEAYALARTNPSAFPLTVRIRSNGGLRELTLDAASRLIIEGIIANLEYSGEKKPVVPSYVRPIILRGDKHWDGTPGGVGVAALEHAWEFLAIYYQWNREYMGPGVFDTGASILVANRHLVDNLANLSFLKFGPNYGGLRTMLKDIALTLGYNDCLILGRNKEDRLVVTELTGANIFVVKDGVLYTPPPSRMILQGLTRDNILLAARLFSEKLQLKGVVERDFDLEFLLNADEAFAVGSATKVTPIVKIQTMRGHRSGAEPHQIHGGSVGPVTRALQAMYFYIERGMPFAMDVQNGKREVQVATEFESRVTKIEIPPARREMAVTQLELIADQTFDKCFRPARRQEIAQYAEPRRQAALTGGARPRPV